MIQDFVMHGDRLVVKYPDYAAGYWLGCRRVSEVMVHKMKLDGAIVEIKFNKLAHKEVPVLEHGDSILFSLTQYKYRGKTRFLPKIEKVNSG